MRLKLVLNFFEKKIAKRLFFFFFAIMKSKGWESSFLETDEL